MDGILVGLLFDWENMKLKQKWKKFKCERKIELLHFLLTFFAKAQ